MSNKILSLFVLITLVFISCSKESSTEPITEVYEIDASVTSLIFASTEVNSYSEEATFTVSVTGNDTLYIFAPSGFSLSGKDTLIFTQTTGNAFPDHKIPVRAVFAPKEIKNYNDKIELKIKNKKTRYISVSGSATASFSTGNFLWAKKSCEIASSTTDATGNCYITGRFDGTEQFGSTTLISDDYDSFIAKIDQNGNYLWAKLISGSGNQLAYSISVATNGNIYITGIYSDTTYFDAITLIPNDWRGDTFIAKMDNDGNFIWANNFGDINSHLYYYEIKSLSLDSQGNSYISRIKSSGFGCYGSLISKFDNNGNELWTKDCFASLYDMAVDVSGNCYLTGCFAGTASFGSISLNSTGSYNDIFIAKLDANGNFTWAKKAGGFGSDAAYSIGVDASGNCYLTGIFDDEAIFGSTNLISDIFGHDLFITSLSSNGDFRWVKKASIGRSLYSSNFNSPNGISIATDQSGNNYLSGSFSGKAYFGNSTVTSVGNSEHDIYLAKIDNSGEFKWLKRAGGLNNEYSGTISIDNIGNPLITGTYSTSTQLGQFSLISNQYNSGFVAKLTTDSK